MTRPSALTPLLESAPGALGQVIDRHALQEAIRHLRLPSTVRERCGNITASVAADASAHFTLDRSKLVDVSRRVTRLTRERYPAGVSLHSRWRQFGAGAVDRKGQLDARLAGLDSAEVARTHIDLAVVGVLLDAGAGPEWFYQEAGGRRYVRTEGLAVATLRAFLGGHFSSDLRVPLRADAKALEQIDADRLAHIFQVGADNPLAGLDGRALLLRRLGAALRERDEVFPGAARPGQLYDLFSHAAVRAQDGAVRNRVAVGRIGAGHILRALLKAFAGIWPNGQKLGGKPIGDVWVHPQAGGSGADAGRVPFHKPSQWLAYSLVEPLQWAGLHVDGIDDLTALADARHAGLLLDAGVVKPREKDALQNIYTAADPWVIEWRALTVTLLDDVARAVRSELGEPALTLAQIMEGGTAAAGREIADERRPGGPPPVRLAGDGTLF